MIIFRIVSFHFTCMKFDCKSTACDAMRSLNSATQLSRFLEGVQPHRRNQRLLYWTVLRKWHTVLSSPFLPLSCGHRPTHRQWRLGPSVDKLGRWIRDDVPPCVPRRSAKSVSHQSPSCSQVATQHIRKNSPKSISRRD